MIYKKPENITYTQMAIAIDNMAYSDNCDDELLFEYLYHLSMMLAVKARYFNSAKYYDDFAIFLATSAYFRLRNPKQFMYDDFGNPKMTKIKSILNYLKVILYPRKVVFEQQNYAQTEVTLKENEDLLYVGHTLANKISNSVDNLAQIEFKYCLGDCCTSIKEFLKEIPYKYKSSEWYNIYFSCLLSFLNLITLSNSDKDKLHNAKYRINDHSLFLETYDKKQYEDFVILYHLDDNMKDYIRILVMQIKHIIAKDLSEIIHTNIDSLSMSYSMVLSEINGSKMMDYYGE